ncbi:hypothetical protein [Frondihabitans australicus]|nr:hypothetical protein [Frondihabitans australicus]
MSIPLQQYARSGGRDVAELWIGLAIPLAIIAIVGALLLLRLSPYRRARRLRAANPSAVIATGYWAHETSHAVPGTPDRGQMSTFTLVVDPSGVQLHSGLSGSTSDVNIPVSEITWVHSGVARVWQRSRAALIVSTRSGQIPLLLLDYRRPIGFFLRPSGLGAIAEQTRQTLGLA